MSPAPRRILMVAYHFPPLTGSSGLQRTLRFVQQLPDFGWEPLVLSADPRAYESTSADLMGEIPAATVVRRAFALDSARHLALGGRYLGWTARPDRWISWKWFGIRAGMRMIEEFRPTLIWSTYPIATAHLIGGELARRSGLPWVADFRDPMAQPDYPPDPRVWRAFKRIEARAMAEARLNVFTTAGAAAAYRTAYPQAAPRIEVVENGFDEASFRLAESRVEVGRPLNPGSLTLLHSGIVYPEERGPAALIAALAQLEPTSPALRLRFRAPLHADMIRRMAAAHGVAERVETLPALPYQEALSEMLRADGLLVLQAANCNDQVPVKLYEYLRARRPIVALTDPRGDTARTLQRHGVDAIAPLDDVAAIGALLQDFIAGSRRSLPPSPAIDLASRYQRSRQLAGLLDGLVA